MKPDALFVAAAIAALLTGCQKDEQPREPSFRAVMERVQYVSPSTKTSIDGSSIGWVLDDRILINDVEYKALSGGSASTDFERTGPSAPSGSVFKAIYPAAGSSCSAGTVSLSGTVADPLPGSAFPMYAETSSQTLQFKNLCALVRLDLKTGSGSATVQSVKLEDSSLALSGTCSIVSDGDAWKAVPTAGASQTLTLTCSREINSSGSESFLLSVPPASYGSLKITVTTDKGSFTRTANKAIEALRGSITTIALTLDLAGGHDYVDLALPSGLRWATMNVGATSVTDTSAVTRFTFADASASSWGGSWRLPTRAELSELTAGTYMHFDEGDHGYYVYKAKQDSDKGKRNDASISAYYSKSEDTHIFLPAAFGEGKIGFYWSSEASDSDSAYCLHFDYGNGDLYPEAHRSKTFTSCVRPVMNP